MRLRLRCLINFLIMVPMYALNNIIDYFINIGLALCAVIFGYRCAELLTSWRYSYGNTLKNNAMGELIKIQKYKTTNSDKEA